MSGAITAGTAARAPRDPVAARERRRSARIRALSYVLWAAGLTAVLCGLSLESPWLLSAATALAAFGFAASDLARVRRGGVTPITGYSLMAGVTGVANAIGLLSADTPHRWRYFLYAVDEHLFLASLLALAGAILPVLAFWAVDRLPGARAAAEVLPAVSGRVADRRLVSGGVAVALFAVVAHVALPLPSLGSVTAIFFLLPHMVAFTLARVGTQRNVPRALGLALLVAGAETVRAVLYEYLRIDMISPMVAFVLGALLGSRSLRPLRSRVFLPVYAAAAAFVLYFGAFASVRAQSSAGVQRLYDVRDFRAQMLSAPEARQPQTVLSRLTSFNQLSQIGRIVNEEGFLEGTTLDYLAYAFVPRFLWPGKPTIAKGAWFALRIGQANIGRDGRILNSVNMTIPGELYLNFAWTGVIFGCLIFGAVLAVFWSRTHFWTEPQNTLGTAFGFYLLWVGLSMGADLQLIVTMVAYYLLFVVVSVGSRIFGVTAVSARRPRPRPARRRDDADGSEEPANGVRA